MHLRRLIGLTVLAAAAAAAADPPQKPADAPQKLDLSLHLEALHLEDAYMEEIEVVGERWREPPPDENEWRPETRTWETGRITWGYDSAYDDMSQQRESRLYVSDPETADELPTSTIFRVRF